MEAGTEQYGPWLDVAFNELPPCSARPCLYALLVDPTESRDRAATEPAKLEEMLARCAECSEALSFQKERQEGIYEYSRQPNVQNRAVALKLAARAVPVDRRPLAPPG
jgi:hypothetical protein